MTDIRWEAFLKVAWPSERAANPNTYCTSFETWMWLWYDKNHETTLCDLVSEMFAVGKVDADLKISLTWVLLFFLRGYLLVFCIWMLEYVTIQLWQSSTTAIVDSETVLLKEGVFLRLLLRIIESSTSVGSRMTNYLISLCNARFHWLKCAFPGKVITGSPCPRVRT